MLNRIHKTPVFFSTDCGRLRQVGGGGGKGMVGSDHRSRPKPEGLSKALITNTV